MRYKKLQVYSNRVATGPRESVCGNSLSRNLAGSNYTPVALSYLQVEERHSSIFYRLASAPRG